MKAPGLIARFQELARVPTANRQSLCRRTIETYSFWLRSFGRFTDRKPASQWRGADVSAWMFHLAREGYSDKSRSQALCAVVWAFRHILHLDPGVLELPAAPKQRQGIRTIPTREELARVFAGLRGQARMMAAILYGAGLRVEECCKLRVQDIDFAALTIRIHNGKGDKDRLTLLPVALVPSLQRWIAWRAALHERDVAEGAGFVEMPGRLALKYKSAPRELRWQFLFPSTALREQRRWYATPEALQKAMRKAVAAAGIIKRVTPHTLRHAFATHAMRAGNDIATVQLLIGHERLETTQIYVHGDAARGVSPLDVAPFPPRRRVYTLRPVMPPPARAALAM